MFTTIKTVFARTATLAAIATLAAAGSAASAETFESNGRTAQVRHADLDLSKAADQKILRQRISMAASKVCSSLNLSEMQQCRAKSLAHVQVPVNAAIARAATGERYADAGKKVDGVAGN